MRKTPCAAAALRRVKTPPFARLDERPSLQLCALAHYPHSEYMAELADEMGLLLWEEIPVYWTIQWENPATLALARQQLREVIERDHDRASVIICVVANETPVSPARHRLSQATDRRRETTRWHAPRLGGHEVRRDPTNP